METVLIRKATINDLETLLRFEQFIIEAERPFDPTIKRSRTQYYDLPALLTSDSARLVAAETEQQIVGCGYARLESSKPFLQHSRHAYLGFMFVVPEHRGKGINQRIIEDLKAWSLSKGVHELRLEVYHENEAAIKAYEKVGFQKLLVEMRLKVGDEGNSGNL